MIQVVFPIETFPTHAIVYFYYLVCRSKAMNSLQHSPNKVLCLSFLNYPNKGIHKEIRYRSLGANGEWWAQWGLKATWKAPINLCLAPRLWDTPTKIISWECWWNFFEIWRRSRCGYFCATTSLHKLRRGAPIRVRCTVRGKRMCLKKSHAAFHFFFFFYLDVFLSKSLQ